jgi:hypothetical protein
MLKFIASPKNYLIFASVKSKEIKTMKKEITYNVRSNTIMPGFCNSILLHNEMFSDMRDENTLDVNYGLDDVHEYMDDVCKAITERLLKPMLISDKRICNKVEFKEVVSCSDYMRGNDRLVLTLKADVDFLANWIMQQLADGFDEYLGYRWSSHTGFVSYVPDNIDEYMESGIKDYADVMFDYYILTKIYEDEHVVPHIEADEETSYYLQMFEIANEMVCDHLCPDRDTPVSRIDDVEDLCYRVNSKDDETIAQARVERILDYLQFNGVIDSYNADKLDWLFSDEETN